MGIKVDGGIGYEGDFHDLRRVGEIAQTLESQGFDGMMVAEIAHDPFPALTIAGYESRSLAIRSSIALALARNPMSMAYLAHDLNALTGGRFTLGMGSQIKAHITRRFDMPWLGPAKQMKDYVQAMHAIWDCWYEDSPLHYQGECYQFSLMPPEFKPTNIGFGRPKLAIGAVGPKMTQAVAQVADGLILHSFCTPKHLHEVVLPEVERELAACGRRRDDFEIQFVPFMATGETEEDLQQAREDIRFRIGFYGSTPAYRPVLETHGWGDLQPELRNLTQEGRWHELGSLISDEILETFACVGEPLAMARQMHDCFAGQIDRTAIGFDLKPETISEQLAILKR